MILTYPITSANFYVSGRQSQVHCSFISLNPHFLELSFPVDLAQIWFLLILIQKILILTPFASVGLPIWLTKAAHHIKLFLSVAGVPTHIKSIFVPLLFFSEFSLSSLLCFFSFFGALRVWTFCLPKNTFLCSYKSFVLSIVSSVIIDDFSCHFG